MNGGRPAARLVTPVIVRLGVLVGLIAIIAITGMVLSTRSVDYLTEDLAPASTANHNVLQDLTDMDAAVGAWVRSGQVSAIDDYRQALARLPGHEQQVRRFALSDVALLRLVTRQEESARAWLEEYGDPRIGAAGGPGTFDPQRFETGKKDFTAIRQVHQATQEEFDRRVRDASSHASLRFKTTILAVLVLAVMAWVAVSRARRKLLRELSEPLLALEAVVQKLASNEPGARADLTGPKEVRAVAAALNQLAEGQGRAQAVEVRIQTELRNLDTAKDDFVSNVSHELRTPLTTISGYLELVAEEFDGQLTAQHERMLEATRRNVFRLKLLIDDLLALSRAENRATDLEQFDVTTILRDAVTDVRITAARRGVRIDVSAPDEPLLVLADRAMLNRAFLNVVSNAVKFSHDNATIEITITREQRQVVVVTRDHGIGIPAAELDRLGTRFFRASNAVANEIAGTGLGVRIVQTIVDKHAGDVLIESTEGEGTSVTIRLRLQGDPVPAELQSATRE